MKEKRILIVFGTTEGHTRKIAEHIGEYVRARGHAAQVFDSAALPPKLEVDQYDAYILAGSLHGGKHQRSLVRFARENIDRLESAPSAFLSASGSAAGQDKRSQEAARQYIGRFIDETGWQPDMVIPVAGAILYTKYGFILRTIMKLITKKEGGPTDTSRDYEMTDWNALDRFVGNFLDQRVFPGGLVLEGCA